MKLLLAPILVISAVPALAGDPNADLVAPREATSIQERVPVLPDSIMINNFAMQANVNAATAPLGSIVGNSISGIGGVGTSATQPLTNPSFINSITPPRIR